MISSKLAQMALTRNDLTGQVGQAVLRNLTGQARLLRRIERGRQDFLMEDIYSQIRTIDKKRLITPKLSNLSKNIMNQIDEAIKKSLALH